MEQYYNDFVKNLKSLIIELDTFYPTPGTKNFLTAFDKLKMSMVIARFNKIGNRYKKNLECRDEQLFSNAIKYTSFHTICPGINLALIWTNLNQYQKDRIWTYLQILNIASSFIMELSIEQTSSNNSAIQNITPTPSNFNPYEGLSVSSDIPYSMEDILSGPTVLPGETPTDATGGIASMLGIKNPFNMEELANELRNMNPEDIEQATNNIKQLFGSNVDKTTSDMLTDMLTDITDELKNPSGTNTNNPMEKLVNIAESVAKRMVPKMENKNINMDKLWKSTQEIAEKCGEDNVSVDGINPFKLLNNLMGSQMQNNTTGQPTENYLQQCKQMFEKVGLKDFDVNQLKNMQNNQVPQSSTRDRLRKKMAEKHKK